MGVMTADPRNVLDNTGDDPTRRAPLVLAGSQGLDGLSGLFLEAVQLGLMYARFRIRQCFLQTSIFGGKFQGLFSG